MNNKPKHQLDYAALNHKLSHKTFKLSEIKGRIVKLAFDVVRLPDHDEGANLWQIQSADDGDYIVALYQADDFDKKSDWDVSVSKTAHSLQISYKGDPIVKMAASQLGIPSDELSEAQDYLPNKLETNPKLVRALLNQLPPSVKQGLFNKYPELDK